MPNPENLKRYGKERPPLSREEAQMNGKKGGQKSGEVRKELATFRHYLEMALSKTVKDKDGVEHSYKEIGAMETAKRYAQGDAKAQELVLKMLGEMPSDKTEITGLNGTPLSPPVINILPVQTKDEE